MVGVQCFRHHCLRQHWPGNFQLHRTSAKTRNELLELGYTIEGVEIKPGLRDSLPETDVGAVPEWVSFTPTMLEDNPHLVP